LTATIPQPITRDTGIASLINASNNRPPQEVANFFGEDGFTFGDIIDIVNPLQHLPIVGTIYRKITGDTIAPAMQIAGDALFGGPVGAIISMVTTALKSVNNNDSYDPNSPSINNTFIANNTPANLPNVINANDYTGANNRILNQADYGATAKPENWVLSSENTHKQITLNQSNNSLTSMNTLKRKHVYQPADGIVNLAYKNTEKYTDVISSNNSPKNTIDVIIGSNINPG
jgi:hypothetical protein